MKDNGVVLSTKEGMAQVEVKCFRETCQKCPVRSLCIGQNQSKGILTVRNPLNAFPGDEVSIEIHEEIYNKKMILVFGSLLFASLLGMGAGHICSLLLSYSSSVLSPIGLLLGLILAGIGLFHYFRKRNKNYLYPVIRDIIKKGDFNG
jgi:positive regulator of sigma E activity